MQERDRAVKIRGDPQVSHRPSLLMPMADASPGHPPLIAPKPAESTCCFQDFSTLVLLTF